jgi:CMP-N,N'-diacetyllegionaminic acid synthase
MYGGKKLLCIIPARSGSKGLPHKNIRDFHGKPLMAYAIETAEDTGMFDVIYVSTDSEQYAEIAERYGASVPFLRPAELAGDSSLAGGYIRHALTEFERMGELFDYFALLQPTSPLRRAEHVAEGVRMAVTEGLDSVVAFSEAEHPIAYYHELPEDLNLGGLARRRESNRQEERRYYRINGLLYVCSREYYLRNGTFYGPNGKALIIDSKYAIDIDSESDFETAEFLYRRV